MADASVYKVPAGFSWADVEHLRPPQIVRGIHALIRDDKAIREGTGLVPDYLWMVEGLANNRFICPKKSERVGLAAKLTMLTMESDNYFGDLMKMLGNNIERYNGELKAFEEFVNLERSIQQEEKTKRALLDELQDTHCSMVRLGEYLHGKVCELRSLTADLKAEKDEQKSNVIIAQAKKVDEETEEIERRYGERTAYIEDIDSEISQHDRELESLRQEMPLAEETLRREQQNSEQINQEASRESSPPESDSEPQLEIEDPAAYANMDAVWRKAKEEQAAQQATREEIIRREAAQHAKEEEIIKREAAQHAKEEEIARKEAQVAALEKQREARIALQAEKTRAEVSKGGQPRRVPAAEGSGKKITLSTDGPEITVPYADVMAAFKEIGIVCYDWADKRYGALVLDRLDKSKYPQGYFDYIKTYFTDPYYVLAKAPDYVFPEVEWNKANQDEKRTLIEGVVYQFRSRCERLNSMMGPLAQAIAKDKTADFITDDFLHFVEKSRQYDDLVEFVSEVERDLKPLDAAVHELDEELHTTGKKSLDHETKETIKNIRLTHGPVLQDIDTIKSMIPLHAHTIQAAKDIADPNKPHQNVNNLRQGIEHLKVGAMRKKFLADMEKIKGRCEKARQEYSALTPTKAQQNTIATQQPPVVDSVPRTFNLAYATLSNVADDYHTALKAESAKAYEKLRKMERAPSKNGFDYFTKVVLLQWRQRSLTDFTNVLSKEEWDRAAFTSDKQELMERKRRDLKPKMDAIMQDYRRLEAVQTPEELDVLAKDCFSKSLKRNPSYKNLISVAEGLKSRFTTMLDHLVATRTKMWARNQRLNDTVYPEDFAKEIEIAKAAERRLTEILSQVDEDLLFVKNTKELTLPLMDLYYTANRALKDYVLYHPELIQEFTAIINHADEFYESMVDDKE